LEGKLKEWSGCEKLSNLRGAAVVTGAPVVAKTQYDTLYYNIKDHRVSCKQNKHIPRCNREN